MISQTPSEHSPAVQRHVNHITWLLDEWLWQAFLTTAIFSALATLVG